MNSLPSKQVSGFTGPIKVSVPGWLPRCITITDSMDNRGIIDENSQKVLYESGDAHNLHVVLIDNEPHLQIIQYIQKTDDYVDIYAIASDINLDNVANLEYLGQLIAEKVQQFKNPEA